MVFQLRVLRTFPIPSSALAATLVFLPILSIAAVGVIVTTLAVSLAGQAVMLQTINSFLMIGAKATIMVTVIVLARAGCGDLLFSFLANRCRQFHIVGCDYGFSSRQQNPGASVVDCSDYFSSVRRCVLRADPEIAHPKQQRLPPLRPSR